MVAHKIPRKGTLNFDMKCLFEKIILFYVVFHKIQIIKEII